MKFSKNKLEFWTKKNAVLNKEIGVLDRDIRVFDEEIGVLKTNGVSTNKLQFRQRNWNFERVNIIGVLNT